MGLSFLPRSCCTVSLPSVRKSQQVDAGTVLQCAGQMQRGRTRTKRQRNEGPKTENSYEYGVPMSGLQEESLECQEGPSALCHSPNSSYLDQQSSDASTSTQGPLMPMNAMRLQCPDLAFWSQYMRQVYIGNSHCPVNGWYQACRYTSIAILLGSVTYFQKCCN